ncbi:MAG: hypothetical protein GYB65_13755 [Chloroflexi bacterium]|nr:hypothetical protein [Chloroflexota bacterium]
MSQPHANLPRTSEEDTPPDQTTTQRQRQFLEDVDQKAVRRAQARNKDRTGNMWFGLGTFGMVGWSVVVPTLIGIVLGIWLDEVTAMGFSWRLTLMFVGLVIGCLNAWYWITKEQRQIESERERRRHE